MFGRLPPYSIRARVIERGGEVVGMAGYYVVGSVAVMFSDMKGHIPAAVIWRESKAMMATMKLPAICISESGSGAFLERLGWRHVGPTSEGEVYEWQP